MDESRSGLSQAGLRDWVSVLWGRTGFRGSASWLVGVGWRCVFRGGQLLTHA